MSCNHSNLVEMDSYMIVCTLCGVVQSYNYFVDEVVYDNNWLNQNNFTDKGYKCIIHFKKFLKCFQDKSNSYVRDDIIEMIKKDIANGKAYSVRESLKNHKLFSYYIHLPQIENRIFGKKPININYNDELKLIRLFLNVEKELRKINIMYFTKRKQILRYKQILKRLLYFIGLDEIANTIPDLVSKSKREEFNKIWSMVNLHY